MPTSLDPVRWGALCGCACGLPARGAPASGVLTSGVTAKWPADKWLADEWLAAAFLAGLSSACAFVDPIDLRYDTVARSLAKGRNEFIFLNLIRASHDYPLSFVTVANVTPSMTNVTSFGLPSFLLGPPAIFGTAAAGTGASLPTSSPGRDAIFGNTTASNSTSVATNFSVSTQETSTFYGGFLKPIDLQILDYFIRQGYSRELLFWLFTDAVEISAHGKTFGTRYSPPNDYGCPVGDPGNRCFGEFVQIAVAAGPYRGRKIPEQTGGGGGGGGELKSSGGGKSHDDHLPAILLQQGVAGPGKEGDAPGTMGLHREALFRQSARQFQPGVRFALGPDRRHQEMAGGYLQFLGRRDPFQDRAAFRFRRF